LEVVSDPSKPLRFLGSAASNTGSLEEPIFLTAAMPLAGRGYCLDV
jgi:hypothetical protein